MNRGLPEKCIIKDLVFAVVTYHYLNTVSMSSSLKHKGRATPAIPRCLSLESDSADILALVEQFP